MARNPLAQYLRTTDTTCSELAVSLGASLSAVYRWSVGERVPGAFYASQLEQITKGKVPASCWPPPHNRRRPRR